MGYYASVHVFGQAVKTYFDQNKRPNNFEAVPRDWKDKILRIIKENQIFFVPHLGNIELNVDGDTEGSFALKAYNSSSDTFVTWMYYYAGDTDLRFFLDENYYVPAGSPLTTRN